MEWARVYGTIIPVLGSNGSDFIARPDGPCAENLGAQAAAMDQGWQDSLVSQAGKMRTGLAQLDPSKQYIADLELSPYQVIQGYTTRDDIPAAIAQPELKVEIAPERFDALHLN
jgi:hypothetical protein